MIEINLKDMLHNFPCELCGSLCDVEDLVLSDRYIDVYKKLKICYKPPKILICVKCYRDRKIKEGLGE